MNIGNKIREARKQRGLNMKEFARRVGISYLTLYRVETDRVSPSVALFSEIAHHLNQPLVNLFDDHSKFTIVRAGTVPTVESKEEYEIGEGDLICFDSSVKHSAAAPGPAKFLAIYLRK